MFTELLHLFFPRLCPSCGNALHRKEKVICFSCRYRLPRTNFHLYSDNPVARLFWGRIQLSGAAAFFYFRKEGRVQRLLHALKYKGEEELGKELGRMYGRDLRKSDFANTDVIVPVPLHPEKLRLRGYNQSALFGHGLSETMGIPMEETALEKLENTSTQTRKTRYQRWENVEAAYGVLQQDLLGGKRILLVDDVVTTGATLESCAIQLYKKGAASVSIACIAAPMK